MLELGGIHKEIRKLSDALPPSGSRNRLTIWLEQEDSFYKLTIENPEFNKTMKSMEAWLFKKMGRGIVMTKKQKEMLMSEMKPGDGGNDYFSK